MSQKIEEKRLFRYDEVFARPKKDKRYIVESLISEGAFNMWFGPPASHKTHTLIDAICTGFRKEKAWGKFAVQPVPTLYIDGENGMDDIRDVIHLLKGPNAKLPFYFYDGFGDVWEQKTAERIFDICERGKIKHVILDPLREFLEGEENESATVAQFFRNFHHFIRKGITITLIHHNPLEDPATGVRKRPRGSSHLIGKPSSLVFVAQDRERERVLIEQTKKRGTEKEIAPFELIVSNPDKDSLKFEYDKDFSVNREKGKSVYRHIVDFLKTQPNQWFYTAAIHKAINTKFSDGVNPRELNRQLNKIMAMEDVEMVQNTEQAGKPKMYKYVGVSDKPLT